MTVDRSWLHEWTDDRLLNAIDAFRAVPRIDLSDGDRVILGALLGEAHRRRMTT